MKDFISKYAFPIAFENFFDVRQLLCNGVQIHSAFLTLAILPKLLCNCLDLSLIEIVNHYWVAIFLLFTEVALLCSPLEFPVCTLMRHPRSNATQRLANPLTPVVHLCSCSFFCTELYTSK